MRHVIILILLLMLPSAALSAIISVSIVGDSTTISGLGFGLGPTVSLYDNFDDGVHGADINFQATIGAWTGVNTNNPYYDDVVSWSTSPGRGLSMQGGDIDCSGDSTNCEETRQLKYTHGSMVTEFYVSFWVMVPDGSYFPYALTAETFPDISAWKMNWFSIGTSAVANDMIIPSWIGGRFNAGGNSGLLDPYTHEEDQWDSNYVNLGDENVYWAWGDWVRFTLYVKGNDSDPYGYSGTVKVTAESVTGKFEFSDSDSRVFLETYGYGITQFRFNGWMRTQGTVEQQHMVKPVYDDIYIATGARALSRVEIGDAPIFANCTHREIQPALTWSDTGITGTLNIGSFAPDATVYFFVVDADGVASAGKKVTLGDTPTYNPPAITAPSDFSTTSSSVEIEGPYTVDPDLADQSVIVTWTLGEDSGFAVAALGVFSCAVPVDIGTNSIVFRVVDSNDGEDSDTTVVTRTATQNGIYTGSMSGGTYR